MNLIEKIALSHQLKHEARLSLPGTSEFGICLLDHYEKPAVSVFKNTDTCDMAVFEIVDGKVSLLNSKNFTGSLTVAQNLVEQSLFANNA